MEHVNASCIDVFSAFPDICVTFVKVFDTFPTPSFVFNHVVVLGTFVFLHSFPQIWQEAQIIFQNLVFNVVVDWSYVRHFEGTLKFPCEKRLLRFILRRYAVSWKG
jgi:hypothetical protein